MCRASSALPASIAKTSLVKSVLRASTVRTCRGNNATNGKSVDKFPDNRATPKTSARITLITAVGTNNIVIRNNDAIQSTNSNAPTYLSVTLSTTGNVTQKTSATLSTIVSVAPKTNVTPNMIVNATNAKPAATYLKKNVTVRMFADKFRYRTKSAATSPCKKLVA